MKTDIIKYKGEEIALVFRKSLKADGVKFLTPHSYTLQLGLIGHTKGTKVREHKHPQHIKYNVDTTQEFLYIEKGRVKIDLYSESWKKVKTVILKAGDFVLFVGGGHGLKVLEDCRVIEVKQGPYPGDKKAKIFKESD